MTSKFEWDTFQQQLDYLRQRGLDEVTVKRAGLQVVTQAKLKELGFPAVPGLQRGILWSLHDLRGEPLGKYGARVFYAKSFSTEGDKPKFLPPKGQVPSPYFSPLANWDKLEYGQRVFICESYLKADIACMLGFHAIGVSGCWGWSYKKEMLWGLQELAWRELGLTPVICFDSDVCLEHNKLYQTATKLRAEFDIRTGVEAKILILPGGVDNKVGLDDYYVQQGKDATVAFLQGELTTLPNQLNDHMAVMNSEVCVIRDMGKFADVERNILMGRSQFEDVNYADRIAMNLEDKPTPVAKAWTRWSKRRIVDTVKYRPGQERLVTDQEPSYFNLWRGWGCDPLAADVSLFIEWTEDAFVNESEREYFLDWWAYQLQHPGEKL